jgi:pimeloyl-ACP methyl ester carboxylesterase
MPRVHACKESSTELSLDAPERLGHSALADGRTPAWAEWGPPRGTPVVLCPGAAISRHLGISARAVAALGVRLISVDRPGLGASTPAPGHTLADFAADVGELIELRGLGRPALIGNSQGAPSAVACAAAGITRALALVSASDEVAAPESGSALPLHLRDLLDLVATDPDGAAAVLRRFDADAMWDLVMTGAPPCDRAVYRTRSSERAYRTALREGFAQGPAGYVRDTLLAMSRWPIPRAHIAIPVDVWYGEEDMSHSPDNDATLTGRIPGAHRHVVPGIGGAVLWTIHDPSSTPWSHAADRQMPPAHVSPRSPTSSASTGSTHQLGPRRMRVRP